MSEQPSEPVQRQPPVFPPGWSPWPPPWFVERLNAERPPGQPLQATDPVAMSIWHMVSVIPPLPPLVTVISGC